MNPRFYCGGLDEAAYTMSSSENAGFPLANLSNYMPDDLWKSSANTNGQTLSITFATSRPRNFCIIDNHNFGNTTTVVLQSADDSGFTVNVQTLGSLVNSLSRFKIEFSSVTTRFFRILFTNTNSQVPQLGNLFIEQKFETEHAYTQPFEYGNEFFDTEKMIALNGVQRASKKYEGRLLHELRFTVMNKKFQRDFEWFFQKISGAFAPFYFYDTDSTASYVRLRQDYAPMNVKDIHVSDTITLVMESVKVDERILTQQVSPMAILLNGIDESASKASPQKLDVSGAEQLSNPNLDANTTGWLVMGGNTLTHETVIVQAGAGAGKVERTSGSDLRAFTTAATGWQNKRVTLEAWVRIPAASVMRQVRLALSDNTLTAFAESGIATLTADTYTKLVFNTVIPAEQTGDVRLVIQAMDDVAGDIFYFDSCSFTERIATGVLLHCWAKWLNTATAAIVSVESSPNSGYFIRRGTGSAGKIEADFASQGGAVNQATVVSTNNINDGQYHYLAAFFDFVSQILFLYVDGALNNQVSIANVGKIPTITSLLVGKRVDGKFWDDAIGELQQVMFTGNLPVVSSLVKLASDHGIEKEYDLGSVVYHFRWADDTDTLFLKDHSGFNNLTGTNISQKDNQRIADYPIQELN